MFPGMSRDSSRAYKTGKTEAVAGFSGVSFLLRFDMLDSFARVVGTLARMLWRGYSVSLIAFLVDLYGSFGSSLMTNSSIAVCSSLQL